MSVSSSSTTKDVRQEKLQTSDVPQQNTLTLEYTLSSCCGVPSLRLIHRKTRTTAEQAIHLETAKLPATTAGRPCPALQLRRCVRQCGRHILACRFSRRTSLHDPNSCTRRSIDQRGYTSGARDGMITLYPSALPNNIPQSSAPSYCTSTTRAKQASAAAAVETRTASAKIGRISAQLIAYCLFAVESSLCQTYRPSYTLRQTSPTASRGSTQKQQPGQHRRRTPRPTYIGQYMCTCTSQMTFAQSEKQPARPERPRQASLISSRPRRTFLDHSQGSVKPQRRHHPLRLGRRSSVQEIGRSQSVVPLERYLAEVESIMYHETGQGAPGKST